MLEIRNIELAFGGLKALQGFSMTVEKDKIFSLIGPKGVSTVRCSRGRMVLLQVDRLIPRVVLSLKRMRSR